jgi:putative nucleotidyltransferase with HDIG domain
MSDKASTNNTDFTKINISTLRPNKPLSFDVFVNIAGKYLHYIHQGDPFETDRMQRLRKKSIRTVFIRKDDEKSYQTFIESVLKEIAIGKDLSSEQKSEALIGHSKAAVQDMFIAPEKKENFVRTQQLAMISVKHLMDSQDSLKEMLTLENFDKGIHQHSVNVASIAVGLAASLGAPEATCQMVAMGALLHDIGKASLPEHLQQGIFDLAALSEDDRKKHEAHCQVGADILATKKYVSKDVIQLILTHEEQVGGRGFPNKPKKLDDIAQAIGLANLYDKYVTYGGQDHKQAYETVKALQPAPFSDDLILGLKDVLVANKLYTR